MEIFIDAFSMQKAGNGESEYEDAHWPRERATRLHGKTVRVAVADGATDAVYSGLWARMLVKAYGKQQMTSETVPEHLARAARVWERVVHRTQLSWYTEEKARAGAFAALMGLELIQSYDGSFGSWSALACGDCCFFHVRSDAIVQAFPISRSHDFSNAPLLLGSDPQTRGLEGIHTASGNWQEGDCFYLMTDALAAWFLTRCEEGAWPGQVLRNVTEAKDPPFAEWISSLRKARAVKNDDCTLIAIGCGEHC